jgi:hypothetical protein
VKRNVDESREGLEALEKRLILHMPGIEYRFLGLQCVAKAMDGRREFMNGNGGALAGGAGG